MDRKRVEEWKIGVLFVLRSALFPVINGVNTDRLGEIPWWNLYQGTPKKSIQI